MPYADWPATVSGCSKSAATAGHVPSASKVEIIANLKKARRYDVTLAHFNRPGGKTAEGLAAALPRMLRAGRHFGTLSMNME